MAENALKNEGRTGSVKLLRQLNQYEFAVEIDIMREGLNNNKWDYRNLNEHYLSFLGQPILIAYVGNKIGDGHNMRVVRMPDGGKEYTFMDGTAERIIGVLSDNEADFRIEERNGEKWVIAKGRIFSFYAREAVRKIIDTGSMDVSAETEIFKGDTLDNGVEIFTDWAGLGVTILGDDVPPAIPGARIKAMSVQEDVEGMRLCAASLLREAPNVTKQKGVKSSMNNREIALLQQKISGYTVLGASDDGNFVCLLSEETGLPAGYRFADEADKSAIVPERITNVRANAEFRFDEENTVELNLGQVTDNLFSQVIAANSAIKAKDEKIAALEAQVKDMEAKEMARRITDAKKAVLSRLDVLNKDREARCAYGKELAEQVCAKIETGCFNEVCNEKGEWCGDEAAVMQLEALCAREQEKMDKATADKARKAMSWNAYAAEGNKPSENDPDELMAWVTK